MGLVLLAQTISAFAKVNGRKISSVTREPKRSQVDICYRAERRSAHHLRMDRDRLFIAGVIALGVLTIVLAAIAVMLPPFGWR